MQTWTGNGKQEWTNTMADLAEATATPSTIEAGGRTFILHPLTFRDFGQIDKWAREEILRATRQVINDEISKRKDAGEPLLSESEKRIQWAEAYDSVARISVLTKQGRAFLSSSEGIVRLLWLSMRKADKNMTLDRCEAMLPIDAGAVGDLSTEVMIISGLLSRELATDPEAMAKAAEAAEGN